MRTVSACHALGVVTTMLVCAALVASPAHADLDEFRRDVEKEEKENEEEQQEEETEEAIDDEDDESNPLLELLYDVTVFAWRLHHSAIFYADYPYSGQDPPPGIQRHDFIHYDTASVRIDEDFSVTREGPKRKRYWIELATGGLMTDSGDWGGIASFQGRFGAAFGPDVDTRLMTDGTNVLSFTSAGLDLSVLQHDYFGWSLYGKGAFFRGVLIRNGGAVGAQLRSYPFRPVSLRFRGGAVIFESITFAQIEGRLDLHLHRFTVFGGTMLLRSEQSQLLSFETGGSISF